MLVAPTSAIGHTCDNAIDIMASINLDKTACLDIV